MKKYLLFSLLFSVSIFIKAQNPSNCAVNHMLYQYYDKDVKNATLQWAAKCDSAYLTDSIAIPKMIEDSVWGALAAVFNAQNMPERDSVIDMYCIHQNVKNYIVQELIIIKDTSYDWSWEWVDEHMVSGLPIVDSILINYNFNLSHVFPSSEMVTFTTDQDINIRPLCEIMGMVDGIKYAVPNLTWGDGNEFRYRASGTDRFLYFDKAWGDCMAGCYMHHIWQFKIDENCDVEYMGTIKQYDEDESLGEPWNCNITAIMNPEIINEIHINPNPATDDILIEFNTQQKEEIVVFDLYGHEKLKQMIYSGGKLNIRDLNNGIYFLRINHKVFKFIKAE